MPTFARCPDSVSKVAKSILEEFSTHKQVLAAGVTVDYVFAFADIDDKGEKTNFAIKHHGTRALGLCRKMPMKDRALGRADAEITLDGDWWNDATEEQMRALLDHELHHIMVKTDARGVVTDDLGRPKLELRPHDFEVGWFAVIAARHGAASQERIQAQAAIDNYGQYFWPTLCKNEPTVSIEFQGNKVSMASSRFSKIAKDLRAP